MAPKQRTTLDFSGTQQPSDDFIMATSDDPMAPEPTPTIETKVEGKKEEKPVEVEKPEFSKEELLAIFDEILFQGEYTETFKKGRFSVTFRSRTTRESADVSRRLDKASFQYNSTVMQHAAMLNLAYSVINLNGEDWSKIPALTDKKEEVDRYKKISDLNNGLMALLVELLAKFDRKIMAAFKEASENF